MKVFCLAAILVAAPALAQKDRSTPAQAPPPIQDNSFLIEEAYNQPAGVVQHINTFALDRKARSWAYTFTEEWPVSSQLHQLSYTIPMIQAGPRLGAGLGDIALNYRYQLPTGRFTDLAVAPRVSFLIPTGSPEKERGAGGAGLQANLPVSLLVTKSLVSHFNAGATYTHRAQGAAEGRSATSGFNVGQSMIWLAQSTLNLMLEVAWDSAEEVIEGGERVRTQGFLVSPGVRGAINFSSGLQVVPGIAVPIGVGPSRGERSVFFYLSLEHAFTSIAPREKE